ncbi:MAG: translation initiation factor IF-3 [Anaerolineales bacterium]|nr:translation initiation factor IF-3 [Anaerolineales bacterium]
MTGLFVFYWSGIFSELPHVNNWRTIAIRKRRSSTSARVTVDPEYRINRRIRVREVRLISQDGTNHGVVPTNQALQMAEEAELDLVEVAPNANPPVCRIMDYGKFAYEKTKREREARKLQKQIEIKTLRLTPRTSDFHRDVYVSKAKKWLEEGKKVKFQVRFKAREITYPEIGQKTLEEIAELLSDIAEVEQAPKLEGWSMTLLLNPTV